MGINLRFYVIYEFSVFTLVSQVICRSNHIIYAVDSLARKIRIWKHDAYFFVREKKMMNDFRVVHSCCRETGYEIGIQVKRKTVPRWFARPIF